MRGREELTADQWRQADDMYTGWRLRGLSTDPADRPTAETTIAGMYRLIGRPEPTFVWADSPASAVLTVQVLQGLSIESLTVGLREALGRSAWAPPGTRLPDTLLASVRTGLAATYGDLAPAAAGASVMEELEASLGSQESESLGASLWSCLRNALAPAHISSLRDAFADIGQVMDRVHMEFRLSLQDSLPTSSHPLTGPGASMTSYDAGQFGFFDIARRLGVVTFPSGDAEALELWCALHRCADMWWPYEHVCVLADRPSTLHVEPDPLGDSPVRLHCPDGPAMAFRDGFMVHAWHGTRVPADLVEGDGWPAERILTELDNIHGRCALERVGARRVVDTLTEVSSAVDPASPGRRIGVYDWPPQLSNGHGSGARLLWYLDAAQRRDGMPGEVLLPVPGQHADPVAAAADLYDWPAQAYRKLGAEADGPAAAAGLRSLADLIGEHGVDVLEHLDRSVPVPVLTGPRISGEVSVLPVTAKPAKIPIPPFGVVVVPGQSRRAAYSLHGTGYWDSRYPDGEVSLVLGTLTVPDGGAVYLVHPEQGYAGIGPGTYRIGRRRRYVRYVPGWEWQVDHLQWLRFGPAVPFGSGRSGTGSTGPVTVARQSYENLKAIGAGKVIEDFALDRCTFVGSALVQHDDPVPNLLVRRISATRCMVNNCVVSGVRFEDVTVDHLEIKGGLHLAGCALSHVKLAGKIGRFMVTGPTPVPGGELVPGAGRAIVEAYRSVDWALDISEAEFTDVSLDFVPGELVRRDPQTQFLLRRESLANLDGRRLPDGADLFLSRFELTPFDSMVVVAPKRSKRYFHEFLAILQELRDMGLAE